jgi:hypothetical protein
MLEIDVMSDMSALNTDSALRQASKCLVAQSRKNLQSIFGGIYLRRNVKQHASCDTQTIKPMVMNNQPEGLALLTACVLKNNISTYSNCVVLNLM